MDIIKLTIVDQFFLFKSNWSTKEVLNTLQANFDLWAMNIRVASIPPELFDALGHPTRIKILELLSSSQMRFSDLKKELNIENGGLLQFHLGKLQGLVASNSEGNYSLTDVGREALRVVAIKDSAKPASERKRGERMSTIGLVVAGFIFILMGIGTAMGSVSLGTCHFTTSSGSVAGSYLVYSLFYELLAIFFAGCGGGLLYLTGKERIK